MQHVHWSSKFISLVWEGWTFDPFITPDSGECCFRVLVTVHFIQHLISIRVSFELTLHSSFNLKKILVLKPWFETWATSIRGECLISELLHSPIIENKLISCEIFVQFMRLLRTHLWSFLRLPGSHLWSFMRLPGTHLWSFLRFLGTQLWSFMRLPWTRLWSWDFQKPILCKSLKIWEFW